MNPILLSIVQGNYGFTWTFTLTDANNNPISLTGASSVKFECQLVSDSAVQFAGNMTVTNAAGGVCTYVPASTDFAVAGTYSAQIRVTYGSGEVIDFPGSTPISIEVTPKIPVS